MQQQIQPSDSKALQSGNSVRYKSRRERLYDDNESEDEYTKMGYQDTQVASYAVQDTQGNKSEMKPHPMFKNNRG